MMSLVTGVAGFIGSHIAENLLTSGHQVIGIDCLRDFYSRSQKEDNLRELLKQKNFTFIEEDLANAYLIDVVKNVDNVFHEAAQPGVRPSWNEKFSNYVRDNIFATQRLLDVCLHSKIRKFIFASSSSIYGEVDNYPTPESTTPKPISPYGVTKLAAENLCYAYNKSYGIPMVILRYFTVYGPRQRPDMAFHIFIKSVLEGRGITVFGDGRQIRDFTYVRDVVNGTIKALETNDNLAVFNIGAGNPTNLNMVIRRIFDIVGKEVNINYIKPQKGDVRQTGADITLAKKELGYIPTTKLDHGLREEISWINSLYGFSGRCYE